MDGIIRFETTRDFLFETELQPGPDTLKDLRSHEPEGEISTILGEVTGAKCIVGIGKPICISLDDLYRIKGLDLPEEVTILLGDLTEYSFFIVRFACSFLTIRNCRVEEARFDVQLHGSDEKLGVPLAFDLFPSRVITSSSEKKKVTTKIGANLKFFDSGVAGEYVSEFEHDSYDPEIISYGVQTQRFRWKFRRTKQNPLEGDRILFATIGKPIHTQVTADFKVTAEVQTTAFKKLILDSRNDEAANARYILM